MIGTAMLHPAGSEVRTEGETTVDVPVIDLVAPMPGFPGLTRFALVQLDDGGVLGALRSLEDTHVRFLVLPAAYFPDYEVEIDDETVAALDLASAEDALALVVVNPGEVAGAATANLLAPVLLNTRTSRGMQVVLDEALPVRAPLQAAG
jgi:flagellar assembly factor FliW